MKALKGIRCALHPNGEQKTLLKKTLGAQRWLWNRFLSDNKQEHQATKKIIFYNQMCKRLTGLKQEVEWLKEIPSQTLQQTLKALDQSMKMAFQSNSGFPQFRSRNKVELPLLKRTVV